MTDEQLTTLAARLGPQLAEGIYSHDKMPILAMDVAEEMVSNMDLDLDDDEEIELAMKMLRHISVTYTGQ